MTFLEGPGSVMINTVPGQSLSALCCMQYSSLYPTSILNALSILSFQICISGSLHGKRAYVATSFYSISQLYGIKYVFRVHKSKRNNDMVIDVVLFNKWSCRGSLALFYDHVVLVETVDGGLSFTYSTMDENRLQQAKQSVKRIAFRDASGQCDILVKQVAFLHWCMWTGSWLDMT